MKKKSLLEEMAKTIPINEIVTECLDNMNSDMVLPLQELYENGIADGKASRDAEVEGLKEELQSMKKKVEAILNALA